MADSYVQLESDSTGKAVQMFENTVGANTVEAMAVTPVDPSGLADAFVQVAPDSTGKKIQHFQNIVSGQVVQALAVVLVDSNGSPL